MITFDAIDDTGREVAPRQTLPEPRPMGPWDANEDVRPLSSERPCSWCPEGRVRTAWLVSQGFRVSNDLCATHSAEMDVLNAQLPDLRLPCYR